jgi:hypothetical protein
MPVILGKHIDESYYQLDHRFAPQDAPAHPLSLQLLAFRDACEAKGGMRMGREVPSRAVVPFLSHMMIHEPIEDWTDARIRYAGFGMAKFFGRDVTGLKQSEIEVGDVSGTLRELFNSARDLIADNRCAVLTHKAFQDSTEITHEEIVRFPIIGSDGSSRWVLTAAFTFGGPP